VVLKHTFSGCYGDKFLDIAFGGSPDRYAVCSSLGNVYVLDSSARSMFELHTHDSPVWGVSFHSKFHFAVGAEDGMVFLWKNLTNADAEAQMECYASIAFGSDVYCVNYLSGLGPEPPIAIGGLAPHILLSTHDGKTQTKIQIQSNTQAVRAFGSKELLVAQGDGAINVLDVAAETSVCRLQEHSRKVPIVAVEDENVFYSGSFDSTIRAWDRRAGLSRSTHSLKLKNYVTGLDVDSNILAACVGENLYLWDSRRLEEVLGGFPKAWNGLTRGIKVHAQGKQTVTASPDGLVRFWEFL
jgi:WD40 repeat protein